MEKIECGGSETQGGLSRSSESGKDPAGTEPSECRKGQPREEGAGSHRGREEGMGLACLCMPVLRAGRGWVLSAEGGLWTLTGIGLGAVRGGRSTRLHSAGTGPRGRGVEKGRGWGGH